MSKKRYGLWLSSKVMDRIKLIAVRERRSTTAQVEIFLEQAAAEVEKKVALPTEADMLSLELDELLTKRGYRPLTFKERQREQEIRQALEAVSE